jgi:glycosyltransferase involved in cell wall biosynthesis
MKICFVVQRYGATVAGGAEAACRSLATRLATRGNDVEVLTSCAVSYVDWANELPAGESMDDGVVVHRLAVGHGRERTRFAALSERVLNGLYPPTWELERAWFDAQGPDIDVKGWLDTHCPRFDIVVFFTYLYWPTVTGVPAVAGRVPVVVHPTAHDEPPLRLQMIRPALQAADALVFLTPEEEMLVRARLGVRQKGAVIGIGIDPAEAVSDSAIAEVGERYGLPEQGWLLCLGRVDPSKGTPELVDFYSTYRRRHPDSPSLVLAGDPAHPIDTGALGSGVVLTGIVDDETKRALVAGSALLIAPSYFESFSLVVAEAWAAGKPVLAQGRCAVLAGQVARARAGFAYSGYREFDAALDTLLTDPELRGALGAAGRRYVAETLDWERLLNRYEALLAGVVDRFSESVLAP